MIRTVTILSGLAVLVAAGQVAVAADWPCYRGPNYNGISSETAWSADWGEGGPKPLWKASVGIGFSATAVADGRVYTMGNSGKKASTDTVYCFDARTGKEIWKHSYPSHLQPKWYEGGTLSTPTVHGGKVYTLGKMGDLFCLDAKTGEVVWQKQLNKDMGFQLPTWHFSSSGLIVGDRLLFDVGTAGLALDKNTGERLWQNGKGKCGYATPVPFDLDGQPHVAIFGEVSLFAVRLSDGRIAWEFPWKTKYEVNAPDPVVYSDRMFITTGYNRGCALLEFDASEAEKIWESRVMAMQINCPVMWGSYIYGFDENELKCINREDGKEQWGDRSLGKGSLMMSADGRMILMSDDGELVVANADPRKFDVLARARVLPKGRCWTAPVLANGRIYARNAAGDFVCVDVSGK